MGVLNNICENGLLLESGIKKSFGKMQNVIDEYLTPFINSYSMAVYEFDSDKKVQIMKVDIINNNIQIC